MSTTLFSGSVIPTVNTVHMVGTLTAGIYSFHNDLGQMINGDELELRVATQIGAGTVSCIYLAGYAHQQATTVKASPPFVISQSGHVSITQRAGGTRTFYYEVLAI